MTYLDNYKLPRVALYRTDNERVIVHAFGFLGGVSRALVEFPGGQLMDVDAYLLRMEQRSDKIPNLYTLRMENK